MATTNTRCYSFKDELLRAIHDFNADQFKIALYGGDGTAITTATTVYTATGEITGTNYTAGGMNIQKAAGGAGADLTLASANGGTAAADWANAVFANVTISGVRQALLYNSSTKGGVANRAVCFVTWDAPGRSATAADFTVTIPESGTGALRIA